MAEQVNFKRAYYIKLGRKGQWEHSSIYESKARIGFDRHSLEDINSGDWGKIREQLRLRKTAGVATRDLNALRSICESTSEDLWITFFDNTMWWCRLVPKEIFKDDTSRYRLVDGEWSNKNILDNVLSLNDIPGVLQKIQRFQGTVCHLGERETEALRRLVNGKPSPVFSEIEACETALVQSVEKGIKELYWKDFETLVDLVFRESGWRRLSVKGKTMKFLDLELEDPITKERYLVQIKSKATYDEFNCYANQFNPRPPIKWLYFVVHSPDERLAALREPRPDVKLIGPNQLSEMVVRLGLVDWLMSHIK